MDEPAATRLPEDLASELERKFFWWEHVGITPRSHARILAQAMNLGSLEDVSRLEAVLGPSRLVEAMLSAEPGWINERSWEFWRGRLAAAADTTGARIADAPPRRSFDAEDS
jgi:hypothetical protein